jgi:hypothetical protein
LRFIITLAIVLATFCGGLFSQAPKASGSVDEEVLKIDRTFLQASVKSDKATVAGSLDDDFASTDAGGKTIGKGEFVQRLSNSVSTNDSDPSVRVYGRVAVIRSSHGRTQMARVWVKKEAAWELLTSDETILLEHAGPVTNSGVSECENPCKTLPYASRNDAERGIIASWQVLETAVTHHDAATWAQHVADEFVLINANNDHPMTKADRMAILDQQKQTLAGAAPVPLVSAKMFDFGDSVVMTAQHQRGSSKPIHVTRIWIKRDGQWLMAFSQQTTIQ